MDHTSLLNTLTTALETAPQADNAMDEDDFFWPLYQATHKPSQADQRLVRLLEQLHKTPELEAFNNGTQVVANTAHMVDYPSLARWLLVRAMQVGAEQTLENLLRFLAASDLTYRMTLALGGMTLDSSCTLGQNITLLPWEEIPDSQGKGKAVAILTGVSHLLHMAFFTGLYDSRRQPYVVTPRMQSRTCLQLAVLPHGAESRSCAWQRGKVACL
jgi:hypothetical protein